MSFQPSMPASAREASAARAASAVSSAIWRSAAMVRARSMVASTASSLERRASSPPAARQCSNATTARCEIGSCPSTVPIRHSALQ
ncbi:MAG TPA: hypothetical protein VF516_35805 [Kofleriaceae bacterium]